MFPNRLEFGEHLLLQIIETYLILENNLTLNQVLANSGSDSSFVEEINYEYLHPKLRQCVTKKVTHGDAHIIC